jgi:RimJ/RimL family protein N-acetyltransferase
MGEGAKDPQPTFCVIVDDTVVGWVDYDRDEREWLSHGDANLGYAVHPAHRGKGYATRGLQLLVHHLAAATDVETATLLIDPENTWSLGVARRTGFGERLDLDGQAFFKRPVPHLSYSEGTVAIRRHELDDAADDLDATDAEQIRWMWEPWQAEHWASMSPAERLAHKQGNMREHIERWSTGPKWAFAIVADGAYAGYVDCDLANPHVPRGEANISYSSHPGHRGKGYVSRAVRLVTRFASEHTGARAAHIRVHHANEPSLRVARAVGAREVDRDGDYVVHVVSLRS